MGRPPCTICVPATHTSRTLRPSLPEGTTRLKMRRFAYLGVWLSVEVDVSGITLEALDEPVESEPRAVVGLEAAGGGGGFNPLRWRAGPCASAQV